MEIEVGVFWALTFTMNNRGSMGIALECTYRVRVSRLAESTVIEAIQKEKHHTSFTPSPFLLGEC